MTAPFHRDRLYIGGRWVSPEGGDRAVIINPATLDTVGTCALAGSRDVHRAVIAARAAFDAGPWPHYRPADRAMLLSRLMDIYLDRQGEMADLITAQTGSPASTNRSGVGRDHP